jgi:hypothetical protein
VIRVFAGYDEREAVGWHVFMESLLAHSSEPVSVTTLSQTPGDGTTAFTADRFRVPELCDYDDWAISLDGADMMLRADIWELMALRDESKAVMVVKHDYMTTHPRKFIGTEMESANQHYPRKNWTSVMLWNCGHPAHRRANYSELPQRLSWLEPHEIGRLPVEWNHLVREYRPNPAAKLAHWTLGVPGFLEYADDEFADEWRAYAAKARRGYQTNALILHS